MNQNATTELSIDGAVKRALSNAVDRAGGQRPFSAEVGVSTASPGQWLGIDVHRGGLATFHSLRHTFVTALSRSGVSQATAMRLAGHTNQATSLRYSHDVESLRAAVDGLG